MPHSPSRNTRHNTHFAYLSSFLFVATPVTSVAADTCGLPGDAVACDEVTVTAQRREEDITSVPLSITRIAGATLRRDGIVDIGALTARVPGFAANANGIPLLYLRGIGSNSLGAGGDPSVGVYQDGIYLGRSAGSIFDLLDVERVEIIRGPQGVLFGRNSAGGAINIVTVKPDTKRSSTLAAQVGRYGERRLIGTANLPLSNQFSLRVAANNLQRDGFIYNAYSQRHIVAADQWATRATLAYAPTQAFTARLQFSAEDKDTDGASSRSTNESYLTGTPFDAYYSDLDHGFERRQIRFSNLQLDYRFGEWQAGSTTGYRTIRYADLFDATGTGRYARRLYAGSDEDNRQFSQDLLLQRDFNGHHWTFGAGYYRQHADQQSRLESTSDTVNFAVSRRLGIPVVVLPPGRYHEENSFNGGVTQSLSAFADVTTQVAARWRLLTGIRYSHDRKSHSVDGQGSNNGLAIVFPNTPAITSEASWTDWSPRAGINFHADQNTLLYLQYGEGYKSGGFNSFVANAEFAPERIGQLELGAKWHSAQRRVQMQLAMFDYRYRDLQVSVIEGTKAVIRNAAKAHGKGIDAELSAQLTPQWSAGFAAGWLDSKFVQFTTGAAIRNLADNKLTFSPDKQFSAFVEHRSLVGPLRLQSSLRYSYSGKQYFDITNTPAATENAVNVLDATLALSNANATWRATLFGNNLTDTEYVTFIGGPATDSLGAPASKRAMPRMIGLRVELHFE